MRRVMSAITRHKYKIIIAIIVVLGVFFYLQRNQKNSSVEKVKNTHVKQGSLKETLILSGEIKSREHTKLHFQTSGRVSTFNISEGDVVDKNQLIATLDQRELKKNLQKELNDFMKSRWDFDQEKDDIKDRAVTTAMQRIVDKSQFDLNNAVVDVELKNLSLEFSTLRSPISGIVVDTHNITPGMNIIATDVVAEIINPDSLYFDLTADQTEVTKLKKGMTGELVLDAYQDKKISGTIDSISFTPKTDESGTVYGIELNFNNSSNQDQRYRIGMTGDVEFILQEKQNVLYVPVEYVHEEKGEKFVFILDGKGQKIKRIVSTGMETDTDIEILQGLNVGQVIYD